MKIDLDLLSKYRSALMGFAILWVMLYHLTTFSYLSGFYPLDFVLQNGYLGVDVFLLLSGFGLTFSRYNSAKAYFRKRVNRVLIPFWIYMILWTIFVFSFKLENCFSWSGFLWKISTIGYWIGKPFYLWYVSAILLFYIVYYLLHLFVRDRNQRNIFLILSTLAIVACLIIYVFISSNEQQRWIRFLARVPIFLTGVLIGGGGNILKDNKIHKSWIVAVIVLIIIWKILQHYCMSMLVNSGLQYIMLAPFVVFFCLLFCNILKHCHTIVDRILSWFGVMSLELYLVHEGLYEQFIKHLDVELQYALLIGFCLSFPIAWLLFMLNNQIKNLIHA